MPASHSGTSSRMRRRWHVPRASASSSGLSRWYRRAEHRKSGVALELVDEPVVAVDLLDDHREEAVQQIHHLGRGPGGDQLGRADDVDEDHRDVALLAAELRAVPLCGRGDFATDVAAEQITHALAFAQTVRPSS